MLQSLQSAFYEDTTVVYPMRLPFNQYIISINSHFDELFINWCTLSIILVKMHPETKKKKR